MIDTSGLLVSLLPPERELAPRPGTRIRWPGDDREWVWNGREWVGRRATEFDGGDRWDQSDATGLL